MEKDSFLLALFDDKVHELIRLCDDRKRLIDNLELSLKEKEERLQQSKREMTSLQTKYTNLLTARSLAQDEDGFKNAQKRVKKLVREVDECIALLK